MCGLSFVVKKGVQMVIDYERKDEWMDDERIKLLMFSIVYITQWFYLWEATTRENLFSGMASTISFYFCFVLKKGLTRDWYISSRLLSPQVFYRCHSLQTTLQPTNWCFRCCCFFSCLVLALQLHYVYTYFLRSIILSWKFIVDCMCQFPANETICSNRKMCFDDIVNSFGSRFDPIRMQSTAIALSCYELVVFVGRRLFEIKLDRIYRKRSSYCVSVCMRVACSM